MSMNINVDPNTLESILCPACGGGRFTPSLILKYLPIMLSPQGIPGIITVSDGIFCNSCGELLTMKIMQDMAKDYKPSSPSLIIAPDGAPVKTKAPELTLVTTKPAPKDEPA